MMNIFSHFIQFLADSLPYLAAWWAAPFLCAVLVLPVSRIVGCGWALSRGIGPAVCAYAAWMLCYAGVPFGAACLGGLAIVAAIGGAIHYSRGIKTVGSAHTSKEVRATGPLTKKLKTNPKLPPKRPIQWGIWAVQEAIFAAAYVGWAFVRSLKPDIHGQEKFMDFGFMNMVLKSETMPPMDIWQAGERVNYYFFGHFEMAFINRISGVPPEIGYNLALAFLLGVLCLMAFALVLSVASYSVRVKRLAICAACVAVLLVALGGNMHGFIYGDVLPAAKATGVHGLPDYTYWYPDATRFIGYFPSTDDKTIHEFPIYSFIVSDLHGHVMVTPMSMALMMLCWRLFRSRTRSVRGVIYSALLPGFLLGLIYMTNTWGYPIYWGLGCMSVLLRRGISLKKFKIKPFLYAALWGVTAIIVSQAVALAFNLGFIPMMSGVAAARNHSPLWQLLVLWGSPLIWGGIFVFVHSAFRCQGRRFVALLFLWGTFMVLLPELLYVRDIYESGYARANTMFKFTYEAFIMFAVASACVVPAFISRGTVQAVLAALLIAMPLSYPVKAVPSYYSLSSQRPSLDGLRFLKQSSAGDYDAVMWLREREPYQVVILEAPGDNYSDCGRISMATGHTTVQGWIVHQWMWRNNRSIPYAKADEVDRFYRAPMSQESARMLQKYKVKYIVVGTQEAGRYGAVGDMPGDVVFSQSETRIIEVSADILQSGI